jgi:hypothetical protein
MNPDEQIAKDIADALLLQGFSSIDNRLETPSKWASLTVSQLPSAAIQEIREILDLAERTANCEYGIQCSGCEKCK